MDQDEVAEFQVIENDGRIFGNVTTSYMNRNAVLVQFPWVAALMEQDTGRTFYVNANVGFYWVTIQRIIDPPSR